VTLRTSVCVQSRSVRHVGQSGSPPRTELTHHGVPSLHVVQQIYSSYHYWFSRALDHMGRIVRRSRHSPALVARELAARDLGELQRTSSYTRDSQIPSENACCSTSAFFGHLVVNARLPRVLVCVFKRARNRLGKRSRRYTTRERYGVTQHRASSSTSSNWTQIPSKPRSERPESVR
jgi:hypothetical protein